MPVTAWATPGTVTGSGWVASDAGTLVNAITNTGDPSAYDATPVVNPLILSNFTFVTIPAGAIVDGIEVQIQAQYANNPVVAGVNFPYCGVKVTKDAVNPHGGEKEFTITGVWPAAGPFTTETLGSASDLWAGTFLDTEVNNVGFGFLVNKGASDSHPNGGLVVAYFRARVWYTEVTSPPPAILIGADDTTRYIPGIAIKGPTGPLRK